MATNQLTFVTVLLLHLILFGPCRLDAFPLAPLPPLPGALPLDAAVDELQLLVEEVVRVVGRLQGQPGDRRPRLPPASNYDLYKAFK